MWRRYGVPGSTGCSTSREDHTPTRNIAANPAVVVHIERGDDIVIVEGTAEEITNPDASLTARLIEAFTTKYGPKYGYRPDPENWQGGGLYVVRPATGFAWGSFPEDATRWQFSNV